MEEMKPLRVDMPVRIKELITADSKALGITAKQLYIQILEDFVRKKASERKSIYMRRIKFGNTTRK